jgi:hypothetical protein
MLQLDSLRNSRTPGASIFAEEAERGNFSVLVRDRIMRCEKGSFAQGAAPAQSDCFWRNS